MKKIVLLLLLISSTMFSQKDSIRKEEFLTTSLTTIGYVLNTPRTQVFYQPSPYVKVDLHLNRVNDYSQKRKAGYTTIIILGVGFISASIAANGYSYGSYQNGQYVVPPFWEQTPRVICLGLGVGLTTAGTIGLVNSK